MIIAATYENGNIFQHFGHCENFKIFEVDNKTVLSTKIINTMGQGHGALAGLLAENNVNVLICGGIGEGAKKALSNAAIKLYPGVTGNADNAVQELLNGTLQYNPDTTCNHHSAEHSCGSHTCG